MTNEIDSVRGSGGLERNGYFQLLEAKPDFVECMLSDPALFRLVLLTYPDRISEGDGFPFGILDSTDPEKSYLAAYYQWCEGVLNLPAVMLNAWFTGFSGIASHVDHMRQAGFDVNEGLVLDAITHDFYGVIQHIVEADLPALVNTVEALVSVGNFDQEDVNDTVSTVVSQLVAKIAANDDFKFPEGLDEQTGQLWVEVIGRLVHLISGDQASDFEPFESYDVIKLFAKELSALSQADEAFDMGRFHDRLEDALWICFKQDAFLKHFRELIRMSIFGDSPESSLNPF